MPAAVAVSVPITSAAIATLFCLSRRISPMVSNQPARKPRRACGRSAMILSVAKITWIWKSFTRSPKRSRMRPLAALDEFERGGEVDDAAVERLRPHGGDARRVLADRHLGDAV